MFHAVNAKTGTEIFSLKFSGRPTFSSPAIARGILYVGSHSGKLFAINLAQQKIAWEFQTEGARENGALYTEDDGTPKYEAAYAGDFYDDLIVGVRKLMTVGGIYSSPVLVDGVLYFGSTDGYIYALIDCLWYQASQDLRLQFARFAVMHFGLGVCPPSPIIPTPFRSPDFA